MTTSLTRAQDVRQPYYRRFAVRTTQWTLILTTALVAGQYVPLLFGLAGVSGLAVGTPVAIAAGILTHAAVTDRQRWAVVLTCLVWAAWLVAGYTVSGIHNLVTLTEALGFNLAVVGIWVALADVRQERQAARR